MEHGIVVRVRHVESSDTFVIRVSGEGRLPQKQSVRAVMTTIEQARITAYNWEYKDLASLVDDTCKAGTFTPEQWADLIARAMLREQVARDPEGFVAQICADGDLVNAIGTTAPAYMAVGGAIFRLVPTQYVAHTKALAAMKKKYLDATRAEARILVDTAKAEAEMQARHAQRIVETAKAKAEALFSKSKAVIPAWANHMQEFKCYEVDGARRLFVSFWFSFYPVEMYLAQGLRIYRWEAVPQPERLKMKAWLALDSVTETYDVQNSHADRDYPELPHMSHHSTCATIEGLPDKIEEPRDLITVGHCFERAMGAVNLGSILRKPDHPSVAAFFPPLVLEAVKGEREWDTEVLATGAEKRARKEEAETWTTA